MKVAAKILSLIIATVLCCSFFACSPSYYSKDFFFFNTQITVVTKGKAISQNADEELRALFESLEKEFSPSGENSFTKTFNELPLGETATLSDNGIELFDLAKTCYDYTTGLFNPLVFPLIKLWEFYPNYPISNFSPPSEEQISKLLTNDKLNFSLVNREGSVIKKEVSGVEVDFGGILKGFAIDKSATILKNDEISEGFINAGGSSIFIFRSDSLKIKHPRATKNLPMILSVNLKGQENVSVSTSGDYEKTYLYEGEYFSHLINPRTGYPAKTGVISATVIGTDGGFSDAITTALCLCSHTANQSDSELIKLMKKIISDYSDSKIFIVFNDGQSKQIITNQKQGDQFTLLDKEYSVINV